MFLKQLLLVFIGLSAGGVISAGIFAFLTTIGVIPRLIGKTKTTRKWQIILYENVLVLGGVLGNLLDLHKFSIPGNQFFMGLFGLCTGIFIGCLVMSLAETLKALPIMNRRVGLAVGIQYVVLSIALGKVFGSMVYFYNGWSA